MADNAPGITDIPGDEISEFDRPFSERYRIAGKTHSKAKQAARHAADRLANLDGDGFRSSKLEMVKADIIAASGGPMTDAAAERAAKASSEWQEYLASISEARHALTHALRDADDTYTEREFIRLQFEEWKELNANRRGEMHLTRGG